MRSLKSYYLFWRTLYRDKRTPWRAKFFLLWFPLLYGISPLDLLPDALPLLGIMDDIVIIPLFIALGIHLVQKNLKQEARGEVIDV